MGVILADVCTVGSVIGDTWALTGGTYTAAKGRFGRPALRMGASQTVQGVFSDTVETCLHCVFSIEGGLGADQEIMGWNDGSTEQIKLILRSNMSLQMQKTSGSVVLATSSLLLSPNVSYHMQIRTIIDPVTGLFELRLNGCTAPLLTFTGNTRSSANSRQNKLVLFSPFSPAVNFSEILLLDTTGSPTGYQGDVNVRPCTITGDSATVNKNKFATTPAQAAGSHHLNVIDASDASYNSDATTGDIERYQISLPAAVAPKFLAMRFKSVLDDAGPRTVAPMIAQGASESVGADFSTPSSAGWSPFYAQVNDPATANPWTAAGGATAEVGAKVTS